MVQRDAAWEPGTPCWTDLMTTDPAAANAFYSELFGWDVRVGGPETGNYGMCLLRGRPVAGIGGMFGQDGHPPVWSTYLATADVDATAASAEAAGASVVAPAMDVMESGRMAFLQLPSGGVVGLWQARQHFGIGLANESGALTWNEFMTRDYDGAKTFYAHLFGYTYTEIGNDTFHYSTMALPDGNSVGGIGELPAEVPANVPPHWRVYFAVADADATAAKTVELGGSVLQPPKDMPFGRFADLADPQGAMFSIVRPPTG